MTTREENAAWYVGGARLIRLMREALGLTQLELAKLISQAGADKYCDSFLSKLEHGRARASINFWIQLADFLNMKLSAVFVLVEVLAKVDDAFENRRALVSAVLNVRKAT